MVPYLFIGIRVRRILWQMKYMEPSLRINEGRLLLGYVWRRLIHHDNQVPPLVVL